MQKESSLLFFLFIFGWGGVAEENIDGKGNIWAEKVFF